MASPSEKLAAWNFCADIYWVAVEIDTQSTIFDLSALKKQLLIFISKSLVTDFDR